MERALTALVAGWCAARLGSRMALYLYLRFWPGAGVSDYDNAGAVLSKLFPVLAATSGFILAVVLVKEYVPDSWMRTVQVCDAIGIVVAVWSIASYHSKPLHDAPAGILEVELRSPKELLADSKRVRVFFGDGRAVETAHPDRIREEDGAAILPVEMQVFEHRGWSVVVQRNTSERHNLWDRYWFDLALPESPGGAIAWSGWIKPARKSGWDSADDVALRYRWVPQDR